MTNPPSLESIQAKGVTSNDTLAALDLVDELRSLGFTISRQDDRLFVQPRDKLSPQQCEAIRRHKNLLMLVATIRRMVTCEHCRCKVDPDEPMPKALCDQKRCPHR